MNIHPIFVHFPIALLTLYAVFELTPFKKIRALPYWFYCKAILCITGTVGSYATFLTGLLIKDNFSGLLVERHQTMAIITMVIFSILSASYIVRWLGSTRFALHPLVMVFLAFCGLLAITVTGSLGGALAYGPNNDPASAFFYNLLVD